MLPAIKPATGGPVLSRAARKLSLDQALSLLGPAMHIDPLAMKYTQTEIVAFGRSWDGSKGSYQCGVRIHSKATQGRPGGRGRVVAQNLHRSQVPHAQHLAKFPGSKDGIIVIGSHYET